MGQFGQSSVNPEWIRIRVDGQIRFEYAVITERVDADIFVSGKKKLRIQKYPDTCGRGLSGYNFPFFMYSEVYPCWHQAFASFLPQTKHLMVTSSQLLTIFYELAALVHKIQFLAREKKIHIIAPPCNISSITSWFFPVRCKYSVHFFTTSFKSNH